MIDTGPLVELIYRFKLHAGDRSHVDLTPLEDMYRIQMETLTGRRPESWGDPPARGKPSPLNPAYIHLNDKLSANERRIYYAHEIAHMVLGHQGSHEVREVDEVFDAKQEREAWNGAAFLLIPGITLLAGQDVDGIARLATVSHKLVLAHPWVEGLAISGR